MGDWGGQPTPPYYTYDEKLTAIRMGQIADLHDVKFVMAVGDNFYDEGVRNVDDFRFQAVKQWYHSVYLFTTLQ